jgi:hypothetical protein
LIGIITILSNIPESRNDINALMVNTEREKASNALVDMILSMITQEEKYEFGNCTVKIIPKTFIPTNATEEAIDHITVEIYRKNLLRQPKLLKRTKYEPLPILTIRAFLKTLT